jgi:alpha-N-arabinofuranosidase
MKKLLILFTLPLFFAASAQNKAELTVNNESKLMISRHIYGQFAEHLGHGIYGGFWVDKNLPVAKQDRIRLDVVNALKKIQIPNLRWPGGCFADEYHWRDGIGPRLKRPLMVNTNWGGVTEDNSFGTDEFLELCKLLGCEPYIAGNVGSGTVEEMSKWIEYLNSNSNSTVVKMRVANGHPAPYKVTFWGVGNESWGCGGAMTPEFYSDNYKRYSAFAKNYPGTPLKKIASGANSDDYNWTEVMMKNVGPWGMWGLSMHYYTVPTGNWAHKGSATKFSEAEYFGTMERCLKMEELVTKHSAIMDKYDPEKKVSLCVDEWGVWTDVEPGTNPGFLYQQNSLRDALIAATTLNIFNNHCDRVRMAALAQTVNVLQSLILTDKDKMLLTPTYHVFDMYKAHQDAQYLSIKLRTPDYELDGKKLPALNVSASRDAAGKVHISFVNLDPNHNIDISTELKGITWSKVSGTILTSPNLTDINTFQHPDNLHIKKFNEAKKEDNKLVVALPSKSVVTLELE